MIESPEPTLPMDLPDAPNPAAQPVEPRRRCKFCRITLTDEGDKAWGACAPCLDAAEW